MSKRIKILFTISVMLNVLLIGAHVGMTLERWQSSPWYRAYEDLKPETQNLVARSFQEAKKDMKANMEEFREARKDLTSILEAEVLDEDAYAAALERMEKAQDKMMLHKIEMMKGVMAQLPPEERERLSHRMMRPFGKHRGQRMKDVKPPPSRPAE